MLLGYRHDGSFAFSKMWKVCGVSYTGGLAVSMPAWMLTIRCGLNVRNFGRGESTSVTASGRSSISTHSMQRHNITHVVVGHG